MPQTQQDKRDYNAERNRTIAARGRDIGSIPPVVNPDRRESCRLNFKLFCETYFAPIFCLAWSPDHLTAIATIEDATLRGGQFALAMPRGSGKSALCEAAVLWATVYGHVPFVVLIAATLDKAKANLANIKIAIESNDLLNDDFPEVCRGPRAVIGRAQAVNNQICEGKPTRLVWTADELVLPDIDGSCSAGAIIRVAGITGDIRGMKAVRPRDGVLMRPGMVVIDDPQTDESAHSPGQVATRLKVINGAIMGLAGAGSTIAAFGAVTVIDREDVADQLLDRKRNPQWQGVRCKMLRSLPTNAKLWEEYEELWANGISEANDISKATAFYREHQAELDAGAEASWPERYLRDTEASAIQHAMNLKLASEETFFAEYQNEPLGTEGDASEIRLTEDQVTAKIVDSKSLTRGIVPKDTVKLVAFIDVQGALLIYVVLAVQSNFTAHVVDYGTFPDQGKAYFKLRDAGKTLAALFKSDDFEGRIYNGLSKITTTLLEKNWLVDGGVKTQQLDRILIDSGWGDSTAIVMKFARESPRAAQIIASKGWAAGANRAPMSEWKKTPGERVGFNWRYSAEKRTLIYETNTWKTFVYHRVTQGLCNNGTLTIFNESKIKHKMFAEQLTSEWGRPKTDGGRTVNEWKTDDKLENHYFDCLVRCYVAAAEQGITSQGHAKAEPKKRRKLDFKF